MDFQIGTVYKFNTLAPAILGATHSGATLIGMMNYQSACAYINPRAMQANVGPLLPPGTPLDEKKYTYYQFQFEGGGKIVLASAWIDMNSVTVVTNSTLLLTVRNASDLDASRIRTALILLGYSNLTIEQTDNSPV